MKYQSSRTKQIHELTFSGKKRQKCPECGNDSKRKNPLDLEYYKDSETAYCHKCETTYFSYKPYQQKKQYTIPKWENKTKLTDRAVKWFTGRMISQSTLNKMLIYSDTEYMPQLTLETEVICFPFFVGNDLKNIKYRGSNKAFKLFSGAELIWYNFNIIEDNKEVIICEGEIDCLTWIENGYYNCISVPNGANNNLEYLDNSIDCFNHVEKIYLSTDCDTKGIELRDEFIRRFGVHRCYLINYKGVKDANEYFLKNGGLEFKELINNSKPVPVKGVVEINEIYNDIVDLFEHGVLPGKDIQIPEIDKYITWELSRFVVVTGWPGSGKSEFVDMIVVKLNLLYGWKAAYFSPENFPLKYHYAKLHEKHSGEKFKINNSNTERFYSTYEYINDNYYYILNEDDLTVESIIESAKYLVKQKGVKVIVIDPYNKLDHKKRSDETLTQYVSRFLDVLINFAKFNNVLLFLIAHPVKLQKGEIPTLYNISDSAHFYNKCDYGFTVHRLTDQETGKMTNEVQVHWQKIKFKHLGEQGISELIYNYKNGRYEKLGTVVDFWDNSDWLIHNIQHTDPNDRIEPNKDEFENWNNGKEAPF